VNGDRATGEAEDNLNSEAGGDADGELGGDANGDDTEAGNDANGDGADDDGMDGELSRIFWNRVGDDGDEEVGPVRNGTPVAAISRPTVGAKCRRYGNNIA
jgi:hypothetical protein